MPVGWSETTVPAAPIGGSAAKFTFEGASRAPLAAVTGSVSAARKVAASASPALGVTMTARSTVPRSSARVCSSTAAGLNSGIERLKIA